MKQVGSSVARREDARLLAGRGEFVADLAAGTHHVAFVRSPQAHARIKRIDVSAALERPGVIGVFTGADLDMVSTRIPTLTTPDPDFTRATDFSMVEQRLELLPTDLVHHVGQALVAVVAEDRYLAEDAAEAVVVDLVPLSAVVDPEAALRDDAPVLHPHLPSNEAARITVRFRDGVLLTTPGADAAATDGALEESAGMTTVEGTYRVGRHGAIPLETRGVVARPERDKVTVWTSTQIPHLVRQAICATTGWSTDEVRMRMPDVGGGFGTKANVYVEEVLVPYLARRTGRALAWIEDRQEHLTSSAQGRDQVHHTRLTVDQAGRIVHFSDDFVLDVGAGSLWVAGIVANTAIHLMGPYRMPSAHIRGRAAFTNKTVVAQYRGAGRPEAAFALERSLDLAAERLGLSRVEIRRRNLLAATDLPYPRPIPYRDGVSIVYDGADYVACLEAVLKLLPPSTVSELAATRPHAALGFGVASYLEATGRGPYETAHVRHTSDNTFEMTTGAASAGQSHETTFAQVAADALEVDMEQVHYRAIDTDTLPHGVGTFASRSAVLAGSAARQACRSLVERARERAARLLGTQVEEILYKEGRFSSLVGEMTWEDLARACSPSGALADEPPLDAAATYRPTTVTWTMGVHAAVVAVDRRTGWIEVLRYAVAHEGGHELNPQVVEGQVHGGVAQGIGGALFEEFAYAEDGQPQSTTFADYLLPSTADVPTVQVEHLAVDTPVNPLGVRGVGESGAIAAYPVLAGAVDDALGAGWHQAATPMRPAPLLSHLRTTEVPR